MYLSKKSDADIIVNNDNNDGTAMYICIYITLCLNFTLILCFYQLI